MPFKSEAQRRKFHVLVNQGKMSPETLKEWEAHTPKGKKLPARVSQPKAKKSHVKHLVSLANFNQNLDTGRKSVILTYKKANGRTVKRKIDPLKVKDDNLVVAFDHKRQALRSFKAERIKDMKKLAFMAVNPATAGTIGSLGVGYSTGKEMAETTSNMVSSQGYKTKNESLARNVAKVTGTVGTLAGLAFALKHKGKAKNLLRKHISNHPEMDAVYEGAVPFFGGVGGGAAAGAATGALVGLRGKFKGEKRAFIEGFFKSASLAEHAYHSAELLGLGILAAPSLKHMAGMKPMKEKNYHRAEMAGLGILAAPSAIHMGKSVASKAKPFAKRIAQVASENFKHLMKFK